MKRILILTLGAFLLLGTVEAKADNITSTSIEQDQAPITISVVNGSSILITNADNKIVSIYNVTGVEVKHIRIDSPSKTIELNDLPKGCYIVKIGKVTKKVYLR